MVYKLFGNAYSYMESALYGGSSRQYVQQDQVIIENSSREKSKNRKVFTINGIDYANDNLISEGGYGFVYRVHRKKS